MGYMGFAEEKDSFESVNLQLNVVSSKPTVVRHTDIDSQTNAIFTKDETNILRIPRDSPN